RGTLEGIQLWVALPDTTRNGPGAFEHHAALPRGEFDGTVATVFMGQFGGLRSPARADTPLAGVDLAVHRPTTLPLRPDWEYAAIVLRGAIAVHGQPVLPG